MNRNVFSCIFILIILANGCGGERKYVPTITLTKTGQTIDAIAEFHNLYPVFTLMRGNQTFGLDAPTAKRVEPSDLVRHVMQELVLNLMDGFGQGSIEERTRRRMIFNRGEGFIEARFAGIGAEDLACSFQDK